MSIAARSLGYTLLAIATTWGVLLMMAPFNAELAPATCTTTHCFCEKPRMGGLMLQPSNSWSSFGYVFTGFFLMLDAQARRGTNAFPPEGAIMFGIAAITVGIGSVLLHATLTLWGQFADVLGMYLVSGFSLVYALAKIGRLDRAKSAMLYAAVCIALVAILLIAPEARRWLFFAVLLTALIVEIAFARPLRPGVILRYLLLAVLVKAIGFGVWVLDQNRIVCAPDSLIQGHAFWHVCGAVSLWLTYCYFRSERPAQMVDKRPLPA
jgi:dihydroceramidase